MRRLLTLLAIHLLTASPLLAQCALCAESLAHGRKPGGGDAALGFHWGALFMLGVMLVLLGGLVGLIVYAARTASAGAGQPR